MSFFQLGVVRLSELILPLAQAGEAQASEAQIAAASGEIGLTHYLVVSALSFGFGLMVIITRRNTIAVLMGIELMLNAAGLNFVAFSKFTHASPVDGQVVTLFLIVIAAAEAAVALAIALNLFNNLNTVEVTDARSLKG